AKTKNAFVGTLTGNNLLEAQPKILALAAFNLQFPIFAGALADLKNEFSFAGRLKAEVEVVAHWTPIYLDNPVAGLEFQLKPKAGRRDFGNLNAATANTGNCRSDCKFVHVRIMSDKAWFVEQAQPGPVVLPNELWSFRSVGWQIKIRQFC